MANGMPCSGLGRDEEEVEELSENDLIQEGTPQNQNNQASWEEEGCAALHRGIQNRPAN